MAVVVVAVAVRSVSWEEIGFQNWRRGALWGGVIAAVTLTLYISVAAFPATRDLFDDDRVHEGAHLMLYHSLVRIPFGTVLLEELAFRGVLPALFAVVFSGNLRLVRASIASSLLFGLWHVLPSMNLTEANDFVGDWLGTGAPAQVVAVVGAVGGTFLAGLWLCLLRYWSDSILFPILAHVSSNSLAYIVAWTVT